MFICFNSFLNTTSYVQEKAICVKKDKNDLLAGLSGSCHQMHQAQTVSWRRSLETVSGSLAPKVWELGILVKMEPPAMR